MKHLRTLQFILVLVLLALTALPVDANAECDLSEQSNGISNTALDTLEPTQLLDIRKLASSFDGISGWYRDDANPQTLLTPFKSAALEAFRRDLQRLKTLDKQSRTPAVEAVRRGDASAFFKALGNRGLEAEIKEPDAQGKYHIELDKLAVERAFVISTLGPYLPADFEGRADVSGATEEMVTAWMEASIILAKLEVLARGPEEVARVFGLEQACLRRKLESAGRRLETRVIGDVKDHLR